MFEIRGNRKKIRDAFFELEGSGSSFWKCKCGEGRKDSERGYDNFISHVRIAHPDEQRNLLVDCTNSVTSQKTSQVSLMVYSQETPSIHGWLSLVVHGLQPFSVVQNPVFRQFTHHRPICNKALMKYLDGLTRKV